MMDDQLFYVLSLKWSRQSDLLVWWGPDDKGYSSSLDNAGKYTAEQLATNPRYYNNGDGTLAVPCEIADAMTRRVVPADSAKVIAMREASAKALAARGGP